MKDEDLLNDLSAKVNRGADLASTKAVILAGGRGTRLAPYTSVLPKPLMPIGERSILEIVVERLAACGIRDVTFSVGYLSHLIRAVFDNGSYRGAKISYVQEKEALGTAGPLRLVDGLDETLIVMNGDILTTLDFRDLLRYHREHENVLTIATHKRTVKMDYGVLDLDDGDAGRVVDYHEKPQVAATVSMGIYAIEPQVIEYVPEGRHFDFPELVQELLQGEQRVGAYVYDGLWFDIGRQEDYEQAVAAWAGESELLVRAVPPLQ